MIKYHIIGLICLAIAAMAGIEAAALFYETSLAPKGIWYTNVKGWFMVGLCIAAVLVYFRARKFRKIETWKRNP
jgi:hypothetical protein